MYIEHHVIQNHPMRHRWDNYFTMSKNCVITIANKVIKCAPLITALITIGALFSLFNPIEARYILHQRVETTTIKFIPDDVKIVYIGPPARSISCGFLDICLWGSGQKKW